MQTGNGKIFWKGLFPNCLLRKILNSNFRFCSKPYKQRTVDFNIRRLVLKKTVFLRGRVR